MTFKVPSNPNDSVIQRVWVVMAMGEMSLGGDGHGQMGSGGDGHG